MKSLIINVTEEDIREGIQAEPMGCAIARAIKRQTGLEYARVLEGEITLGEGGIKEGDWNDDPVRKLLIVRPNQRTQKFINDFDKQPNHWRPDVPNGKTIVKPFSFALVGYPAKK